MTRKKASGRSVDVVPPSPRRETPEPDEPDGPDPVERFRRRAGLVIMQILYGACVFVLTKAYYERPAAPPEPAARQPATAQARPAPATNPADGVAGSALSADALLRQAVTAFRAQDYATAARFYRQIIERDPRNPDILNNYALVLHYTGQSGQALEHLRTALNLNPTHQRSWLTLGFIHKATGRTSEAREALERAVAIDPANVLATEAGRMLGEL
ncbi:MAG: tetratricopeptide repeat protein [Pseudomonadota bacterium]